MNETEFICWGMLGAIIILATPVFYYAFSLTYS